MKLLFLVLFISVTLLFPQGIGEFAPAKDPIIFPDKSVGIDVMFGEGGFGLGGFYRTKAAENLTWYTDLSISESKDEKEIEYFDYFGNSIVVGKKNRVFLLPVTTGLQYRLFSEDLSDNLRPYINAGAGPSMVVTTPYNREFFKSFKYAQAQFTLGGYIGLGANFGYDKKNLIGLNIRYYVIHFFDKGVESLEGRFQKNLGGIFITINIGSQY